MLIPISYNLRSLFVRRTSTLLTVLGIGATVAILAGVLALEQGFSITLKGTGREDIVVFLRPGATGETDSRFTRDRGLKLIKNAPEIAVDSSGAPLASMECYLGALLPRLDGNPVNVPLRGVQPATFALRGDELRITEGRRFSAGSDEVIVGRKLVGRIRDCEVGGLIQLDMTPFRVVGILEHDGAFQSEIWGDLDRMIAALRSYEPTRVIAKVRPGTVIGDGGAKDGPEPGSLAARLKTDRETPAKVMTELAFLESQTRMFSGVMRGLGTVLAVIMGTAGVFTATNTMLTSLAARTHEIGILLSTGFRPVSIFLSFMLEALALGLLGGVAGCLLVLPVHGRETATMNGQTFTELAFAFQVTPTVLATAVIFSLVLGLLGGALPAWRAARMRPTEALRRV